MRLAMIGPTHPFRGGISHHTTLLVHHLRQAGHEVLFISFTRQYPRWLYGRDDKDPSPNPLTTPADYLLDSLNPLTWLKTAQTVNQFRPELVLLPWWVTFWTPIWAYLSWRIKKGVNPPQLLFLCHNVFPHEPSQLDQWAVRLALGRGDKFIVHAQPLAEQLRPLFPQAPVLVTPLPTYAQVGQATNQPALWPPGREKLLFCGLVRPYKGLDILLEALAVVVKTRPVHLAVVGEFWEGVEKYQAQIDQLQLAPYLTLVNQYVADDLLSAYVSQADVVVLPYKEATQSAVIQLAFGYGTPVITTNVGGLAEAVSHGRTGLVVPPQNPAALAEAITTYFEQQLAPQFKENIAQNSDTFSWLQFVKQFEQFTTQ
jgi:glycosyltransferase involved in cell wall biosynthesis